MNSETTYQIAYARGAEDARKSIEESLPKMLDEVVSKLASHMSKHEWNIGSAIDYRNAVIAINFQVSVRHAKLKGKA